MVLVATGHFLGVRVLTDLPHTSFWVRTVSEQSLDQTG